MNGALFVNYFFAIISVQEGPKAKLTSFSEWSHSGLSIDTKQRGSLSRSIGVVKNNSWLEGGNSIYKYWGSSALHRPHIYKYYMGVSKTMWRSKIDPSRYQDNKIVDQIS